jgi:protein Mpv17
VAGDFIGRGVLEGQDPTGLMTKLQEKWIPTIWTSWHFWPAANVLNFVFIPLPFRVLYWSILSFFWQGYLTHVNADETTKSFQDEP